MTYLKKGVGENNEFIHLQNNFNQLQQKWNKFTHIFERRQIHPLLMPCLPTPEGVFGDVTVVAI